MADQRHHHSIWEATQPSQRVSVDQLISTQHGFIAQFKGRLTNHSYRGAIILVNHFSWPWPLHQFSYVTDVKRDNPNKNDLWKVCSMVFRLSNTMNIMIAVWTMHSSVTVKKTINFYIFLSQCPLPKWNCQKSHQVCSRTSQKVLASCYQLMDKSNEFELVSLCCLIYHHSLQCAVIPGRWKVQAWRLWQFFFKTQIVRLSQA